MLTERRPVPAGSPSRGAQHKPTELAHSFLFCSCVYIGLYGPFKCISFHMFSRNSPLSHSVLPVLILPYSVLPVLILPYWSFQLYISL